MSFPTESGVFEFTSRSEFDNHSVQLQYTWRTPAEGRKRVGPEKEECVAPRSLGIGIGCQMPSPKACNALYYKPHTWNPQDRSPGGMESLSSSCDIPRSSLLVPWELCSKKWNPDGEEPVRRCLMTHGSSSLQSHKHCPLSFYWWVT